MAFEIEKVGIPGAPVTLTPSGDVADAINKISGNFEAFKEAFSNAAITLFGSGWAWLVKDNSGALSIDAMSNAGKRCGSIPAETIDFHYGKHHQAYVNNLNALFFTLEVIFTRRGCNNEEKKRQCFHGNRDNNQRPIKPAVSSGGPCCRAMRLDGMY